MSVLRAAALVAFAAGCTPLHSPIPQPNPQPSDCFGTSTTLKYVFHRHSPQNTGIESTVAFKYQREPKHYLLAIGLEYSRNGVDDWVLLKSSEAVIEFDESKPPVLGHTYFLFSRATCLDGATFHWRLTQTFTGVSFSGTPHRVQTVDFPDAEGWRVGGSAAAAGQSPTNLGDR